MKPSRRAFVLLAWLSTSLVLPGCFSDPDEGPSRHALQFGYIRFASPVAGAATDTALRVGFYVGPNTCWAVEEIGLEVRGDTLLVSGTAVDRSQGGDCGDEMIYGTDTLSVPPLEPGVYIVRAGALQDTLVVSTETPVPSNRLAARGTVRRDEGECGEVDCQLLWVGLSNLPESLPGTNLVVWGDEIDTDPCARVHSFYDVFARVRAVAVAPT